MERLEVKEIFQLPEVKDGHIFNTSLFQSLKLGEKKYFVLTEKNQPISRMIFTFFNGKAISGIAATFGSIDFSQPMTEDKADFFFTKAVDLLAGFEIEGIIIKNWPSIYGASLNMPTCLSAAGFEILHSDVNQHLTITIEPFISRIKYNERKKLNQCLERGYRFMELSTEALTAVYELVENTRDRKGFPVSMSFDELSATILKLPEAYLLFGLYDGDTLIAASVSIRITEGILYNFYHADDIDYRSTSPLVMLVQNIYEFCQRNDIGLLDFGISSEKGVLNEGLFKFKQNLGCDTSEKVTYRLGHG
jgi:GNAT acetyltransferase-like protein